MSRGRAAARTHGNQLEDSRLNKTVGRNNDNTNNRLSLNVARPQEPNNNRRLVKVKGRLHHHDCNNRNNLSHNKDSD